MNEELPDDYVCKICGLPVLESAPGDVCGPCLDDIDDENRDPDRDTPDDDSPRGGCLFPETCCMPGLHMTDECHTAEMLMQQEHDREVEEYKEQVELLEHKLGHIIKGTAALSGCESELSLEKKLEHCLRIIAAAHDTARAALEESHHTNYVRLAGMMPINENSGGQADVQKLGQSDQSGRDKGIKKDGTPF